MPRPTRTRPRPARALVSLTCLEDRTAPAMFTAGPAFASGGTGTLWEAVGDFNTDEKPDVVVANAGSSNATVFLNDGAGKFTLKSTLQAPNQDYASRPVVADFNNDGKADMAVNASDVTNPAIGWVVAFLGKGDGTFTLAPGSPVNLSMPSGGNPLPFDITPGDLNEDGVTDLVAVGSNNIGAPVHILTGKGDGSFTASYLPAAAEFHPGSVVVSDLDLDGHRTSSAIPIPTPGVGPSSITGSAFITGKAAGRSPTW